jgi:beta-lactamase class A
MLNLGLDSRAITVQVAKLSSRHYGATALPVALRLFAITPSENRRRMQRVEHKGGKAEGMKFRLTRWSSALGLALSGALAMAAAVAVPRPHRRTSAAPQDAPSTPKESPARVEIEQLIDAAHADASVAFRSLDGSQQLLIKADDLFPVPPAVIQLPIMIELFAEARAGDLRLTETLVVHNGFTSILDGGAYHLDPKNDPDRELYRSLGKPITLRDLCEHMVAHNSSLAAAMLIERLGVDRIRQRIQTLHADGIQLIRGLEPGKPNDPKPENTATPRGLLESLWALAMNQHESDAGELVGEEMVAMVARAALYQPPASDLPPDPRSAQSVRLAGIGENAMIVYGPHPFVVVVVLRGVTIPEARAQLLALIEHALAAGLNSGS